MNTKRKLVVLGLAAVTLFSTVSVSATATWTTDTVSGYSSTSSMLNYGDGIRFLHSRGISGTGTIKMYKVKAWSADEVAANVNTTVAVNTKDTWYSNSRTAEGAPQSYYYKWTGSAPTASSHMRVSDY